MSMQLGVALRPLGGRGGAEAPSDWPPSHWCATKSNGLHEFLSILNVNKKAKKKKREKEEKKEKSRHFKKEAQNVDGYFLTLSKRSPIT